MSQEQKNNAWGSTASISNLRARARILAKIRQFFAERDILEVETPLLSQAIGTDPHLHFFTTELYHPDLPSKKMYYLQTSPEFAMKRLLASGSGSIYQLTKAFRNSDISKLHNPEFTILEWYRVDFTYQQLMIEVREFLNYLIPNANFIYFTYSELFLNFVNFDPFSVDITFVSQYCEENLNLNEKISEKDTGLQLILAHLIEPKLPKNDFIFIYDYPATQAVLSALNPENPEIAQRFEVYYQSMELANGFQELRDAKEQHQRFLNDLKKRKQLNYPLPPIDQNFLAALNHGLPFCSGVAIGIDRLIMAILNLAHINEVIAFSQEKA